MRGPHRSGEIRGSERVRILAFSNCPLDPLLGSGQTRIAWSEGLRQRGHEVSVWDSDALLGPPSKPFGRRWRLGLAARTRVAAEDLSGIDLIEFYGAEFWLPTWWLSRRPRAQRPFLVAHTDGLELACADRLAAAGVEPRSKNPLRRALETTGRLAFTRSDAFVTASEADRHFATEHELYPAERMAVVPLGLKADYLAETAPSPTAPTRDDRIVFLGSWIARKGTRWAAAVFRELLRERPTLQISLLGVAVDEAMVRAEFPVETQPRLEVRSRLSPGEILGTLATSRVFFLPTEYEGFGLALAEAMAAGCAAVTTPTGFGAELRDGVEALICPFGDATAMRRGIERLLDDADLRVKIATAGQQRARLLRWEASLDQLEATYLRWLS